MRALVLSIFLLLALSHLQIASTEDVCSLPPDAGMCESRKQRWYFDSVNNECTKFTYGNIE